MIANIECLVDACNSLKIAYRFLDKNHNFVAVGTEKVFYFSNSSTPLNNEEAASICKDKEFSYNLLHEVIRMPNIKSYFDPYRPDFIQYREFDSLEAIAKDMLESFTFPFVVKRNAGFQGKNVFIRNDPESVHDAVKTIFDQNSKDYDFVALAQEYVAAKKEFRVVALNKKIMLAYDWKNNFEIVEPGSDLFLQLEHFIAPLFTKFELNWSGLDIILNTEDKLWLIELNSKPGFEHFVEARGKETIVKVYEEVLRGLI